ncbi:MAG: hypothetical protein K0R12_869 [Gammaproteobacteria bacterium]|jgi:hypothetical protein|nr:hypothetical protein [Gammaproteobacteria bacterium]
MDLSKNTTAAISALKEQNSGSIFCISPQEGGDRFLTNSDEIANFKKIVIKTGGSTYCVVNTDRPLALGGSAVIYSGDLVTVDANNQIIKEEKIVLKVDEKLDALKEEVAHQTEDVRIHAISQAHDFNKKLFVIEDKKQKNAAIFAFIPGKPLADDPDSQSFNAERIAGFNSNQRHLIAGRLAEKVKRLHEGNEDKGYEPLVHLDLSFSNVHVDDDLSVRLLDLGQARRVASSELVEEPGGKLFFNAYEANAVAANRRHSDARDSHFVPTPETDVPPLSAMLFPLLANEAGSDTPFNPFKLKQSALDSASFGGKKLTSVAQASIVMNTEFAVPASFLAAAHLSEQERESINLQLHQFFKAAVDVEPWKRPSAGTIARVVGIVRQLAEKNISAQNSIDLLKDIISPLHDEKTMGAAKAAFQLKQEAQQKERERKEAEDQKTEQALTKLYEDIKGLLEELENHYNKNNQKEKEELVKNARAILDEEDVNNIGIESVRNAVAEMEAGITFVPSPVGSLLMVPTYHQVMDSETRAKPQSGQPKKVETMEIRLTLLNRFIDDKKLKFEESTDAKERTILGNLFAKLKAAFTQILLRKYTQPQSQLSQVKGTMWQDKTLRSKPAGYGAMHEIQTRIHEGLSALRAA